MVFGLIHNFYDPRAGRGGGGGGRTSSDVNHSAVGSRACYKVGIHSCRDYFRAGFDGKGMLCAKVISSSFKGVKWGIAFVINLRSIPVIMLTLGHLVVNSE